MDEKLDHHKSEPIYMTPSEVDQGYKHRSQQRNLSEIDESESESVASGLSRDSAGGGRASVLGVAREQARHNQLKRTYQMHEKLRRWEAGVTGGGGGGVDAGGGGDSATEQQQPQQHQQQTSLYSQQQRQQKQQQHPLTMSTESGVYIEEMADQDGMERSVDQMSKAGGNLGDSELCVALDAHGAKGSHVRLKQPTRANTLFVAVPHQQAWVVERMGKFHRVLEPGMNVLLPLVDRVKYVHSLKELPFSLHNVRAVTDDQVIINVDVILFLRVEDAYKASYSVEDPEYALTQGAVSELRQEAMKLTLDQLLANRGRLSEAILRVLSGCGDSWGVVCLRCEIGDIQFPLSVQQALVRRAEAERHKSAVIAESEAIQMAEIKVAEGQKYSVLLAAEAARAERVERAEAEADSMLLMARARAQSLALLSEALALPNGMQAASFNIAEQYVQAFSGLARASNTMILPSDVSSPANMIAQAMGIMNAANQSGAAAVQPQAVNSSTNLPLGGTGGARNDMTSSIADSLLTDTNASRSYIERK